MPKKACWPTETRPPKPASRFHMLANAMRMKRLTMESVTLLKTRKGSAARIATTTSMAADVQRADLEERRTLAVAGVARLNASETVMPPDPEAGPGGGRRGPRGRRGGRPGS